jgi:hypothetical protein
MHTHRHRSHAHAASTRAHDPMPHERFHRSPLPWFAVAILSGVAAMFFG